MLCGSCRHQGTQLVGASWRGRWVSGGTNGSQPGQGAAELGIPRPALWQMQGEAACRCPAKAKTRRLRVLVVTICSRRPMRAVQPRLWAITCSQRRRWRRSVRHRCSYGVLDYDRPPVRASHRGLVIAVGGERANWEHDEPHRRGVGLTLERCVSRLGDIGGAVHPVGNRRPGIFRYGLMTLCRLLCWRRVMEKRTSILRQTDPRYEEKPLSARTVSCPLAPA